MDVSMQQRAEGGGHKAGVKSQVERFLTSLFTVPLRRSDPQESLGTLSASLKERLWQRELGYPKVTDKLLLPRAPKVAPGELHRPMLANISPDFPSLANVWSMFANVDQHSANFGQVVAKFVIYCLAICLCQVRPNLVDSG